MGTEDPSPWMGRQQCGMEQAPSQSSRKANCTRSGRGRATRRVGGADRDGQGGEAGTRG